MKLTFLKPRHDVRTRTADGMISIISDSPLFGLKLYRSPRPNASGPGFLAGV